MVQGALNHFHHVSGLKSRATMPMTDGENGSLDWKVGGGSGNAKQWLREEEDKDEEKED